MNHSDPARRGAAHRQRILLVVRRLYTGGIEKASLNLAQGLLAAGHEVKVWNRSAAKAEPLAALGAQVAATAREAASGVDGVLICLFDAKAVEAVVFGPDGIAQANGLGWLADHSSIDPRPRGVWPIA